MWPWRGQRVLFLCWLACLSAASGPSRGRRDLPRHRVARSAARASSVVPSFLSPLLRLRGRGEEEEAEAIAARAAAARERAMANSSIAPLIPAVERSPALDEPKIDAGRDCRHGAACFRARCQKKRESAASRSEVARKRRHGTIEARRECSGKVAHAGAAPGRAPLTLAVPQAGGRRQAVFPGDARNRKGKQTELRDFRDIDRERQRAARMQGGGVGPRRRDGAGVAEADELHKYVRGEKLLAQSLMPPLEAIAPQLNGLESVRKVDVSNNSLTQLGGLRRLVSLTNSAEGCHTPSFALTPPCETMQLFLLTLACDRT